MARTIDEILAEARGHITRLDPLDAAKAVEAGAALIDIRPEAQRRDQGEIPGAVVIDRNVLEWRLAPESDHRIPEVGAEKIVIIVCDEGYASSLAAATLQELGLPRATDLIGGFQAWRERGLPVALPTPE